MVSAMQDPKRLFNALSWFLDSKLVEQKSSFSAVGLSGGEGAALASTLGVVWRDFPTKYLGIPLGGNPRVKVFDSQL